MYLRNLSVKGAPPHCLLDQFSTKKVTDYRVPPPTLPSAKVSCLFNRLLAWHLTTAFGPIFTDLGFTD